MATPQELDLTRRPIVQESLAHNMRTLSSIRAPASFLLGLCAGALSLSSFAGFAFYLGGSLVTSVFIYFVLLERQPRRFFYATPTFASQTLLKADDVRKYGEKGRVIRQAEGEPLNNADGFLGAWSIWRDVAFGGGVLGVEGIMGFIMAWTLSFNYIGGGT